MPKFKFNKLVRDEIVEKQVASGAKPSYRQLTVSEHERELVNKIIEEAKEILLSDREGIVDEIADVQQAIDDLKEKLSLTDEAVAIAQAKKQDKNGAFKKGLYIDYIELDESDPWVEYYRSNADNYPEIK